MQKQSRSRRRKSRRGTVFGFCNLIDVLRANFSFGHIQQRACHNSHHIIQESVGRNSKFHKVPISLYAGMIYSSHGVRDISSVRHIRNEIMGSAKRKCRPIHFIQSILGNPMRIVHAQIQGKGISLRSVPYFVEILFIFYIIAGMKIRGNQGRLLHGNIFRQMGTQCQGDLFSGDFSLK